MVSQHGTAWSLPKGHIEAGEDKMTAALREIKEESGLTELEPIKELGSYKRFKIDKDGDEDTSELKTIFMFKFTTNQTDLSPIDPENPEGRWVDKRTVVNLLTHPKDKAFFLSIIDKV